MRQEMKALTDAVLNLSTADETFVSCNALQTTAITLANNRVMSTSRIEDVGLQVTVRIGNRYASASSNQRDRVSLKRFIVELCELAPSLRVVEEVLPFPAAVIVSETPMLIQADADISSAWREESTAELISAAQQNELLASGSVSTSNTAFAVAASSGLFLYQPSSLVHCSVVMRSKNGRSYGFGEERSYSAADVSAKRTARRAVEKCLAWNDAIALPPGRITTVFENAALADIIIPFLKQFDQQAVNEDRSFVRKLDGSSRQGSEVFGSGMNMYSDPFSSLLPSTPFSLDGLPIEKTHWVRNGVIESLTCSRFQAMKSKQKPIPFPSNCIIPGGTDSLAQLLANTERALLVTGFAPLTVEDPKNCLLTGSTKNGLFLIENGHITKAIQNLVLRETPVYFFKRLEQVGLSERTYPSGSSFPMLLPSIRVTDVMYSKASSLI